MKLLSIAIISSSYILFFITTVIASNIILHDISKLYIEYDNGEYEEIEVSPTDYSFYLSDVTHGTIEGIEKDLVISGELNQNSNIKRIGIYCRSIESVEDWSVDINGYIGLNPTSGTKLNQLKNWLIGYGVPTSWFQGTAVIQGEDIDNSGLTSGAVDYNSSMSIIRNNETTYTATFSPRDSFDAKNKKVKIRFKAFSVLTGTENITESF